MTDLSIDTVRNASDHFAVFGLPRRFDLDVEDLERRYVELARLTHPDMAGSEPEQQLDAMELSSRVNDAHRVLADDEARANHLLDLLGGPTSADDKSLPEGFLPIIMMVREELAEAQLEGDEKHIANIEADAHAQRKARLKEIAGLFSRATHGSEVLKSIRTELNALRYYQRLLEQVHAEGDPGL